MPHCVRRQLPEPQAVLAECIHMCQDLWTDNSGIAGIAVVRLLGSIQVSLWRDHAGVWLLWVGLVG